MEQHFLNSEANASEFLENLEEMTLLLKLSKNKVEIGYVQHRLRLKKINEYYLPLPSFTSVS